MRLYYISFFYFNIVLLLLFVLKIDLFFLFFLFIRKTYSIFKESLTEYTFQEFDGLLKDNQNLDLYENKLYLDFGLDAGLEEFYIQNLYMHYALYDISLDLETYSGNFTFKWNDYNVEELCLKKKEIINFKKVYISLYNTNLYMHHNLKNKAIDRVIDDDDYLNLYNYKNLNRREIENPLFMDENEKYYYTYLKMFFLRENFYDIYIKDNYIKSLNYNNFVNKLKKRFLKNKNNNKHFCFLLKEAYLDLDPNKNRIKIKNELLNNSYLIK